MSRVMWLLAIIYRQISEWAVFKYLVLTCKILRLLLAKEDRWCLILLHVIDVTKIKDSSFFFEKLSDEDPPNWIVVHQAVDSSNTTKKRPSGPWGIFNIVFNRWFYLLLFPLNNILFTGEKSENFSVKLLRRGRNYWLLLWKEKSWM